MRAIRRAGSIAQGGILAITLDAAGCSADVPAGSSGFGEGADSASGGADSTTSEGSTGATGTSEATTVTSTGTATDSPVILDVAGDDEEDAGDPCAEEELGETYIGCEYYAVTMLQYMWGAWPDLKDFAISISNASDEPADVTVDRGGMVIESFTVGAGSIEVVTLPWVFELTGQGHAPPTRVVAEGAYHVQSTRPVTVHQYSPLQQGTSNDASLLLPTNAWRDEYVVVSWPALEDLSASDNNHGAYVVIAREDDTMVTVTGSATAMAQPGAGIDELGDGVAMLEAGDVLQVVTWEEDHIPDGDLTGSRVEANKPVSVMAGHQATHVPTGVLGWDHLEETMLPLASAGRIYVVVPPAQGADITLDKATVVRIVATEDDTQLTFDPPQPGAPTTIDVAGEFIELPMSTERYVVESNHRILVAQYMVGADAGYGQADPSMLLAVPTEQWRTDYLFHAPPSWESNLVDVVTNDAATVSVDGVDVTDWQPIGTTGYKHAHVPLNDDGNGTHTLSAFPNTAGITVYGIRLDGSYWYPGGLDLHDVPAG